FSAENMQSTRGHNFLPLFRARLPIFLQHFIKECLVEIRRLLKLLAYFFNNLHPLASLLFVSTFRSGDRLFVGFVFLLVASLRLFIGVHGFFVCLPCFFVQACCLAVLAQSYPGNPPNGPTIAFQESLVAASCSVQTRSRNGRSALVEQTRVFSTGAFVFL